MPDATSLPPEHDAMTDRDPATGIRARLGVNSKRGAASSNAAKAATCPS